MFNIIYAKNELMLDEFKTALLVDIFWQLLEFNPEAEPELTSDVSKTVVGDVSVPNLHQNPDHTSNNGGSNVSSPAKKNVNIENNNIEYRGDGMEVDKEFEG